MEECSVSLLLFYLCKLRIRKATHNKKEYILKVYIFNIYKFILFLANVINFEIA